MGREVRKPAHVHGYCQDAGIRVVRRQILRKRLWRLKFISAWQLHSRQPQLVHITLIETRPHIYVVGLLGRSLGEYQEDVVPAALPEDVERTDVVLWRIDGLLGRQAWAKPLSLPSLRMR